MDSDCIVPTSEKVSETRSLTFSKSKIYCKQVGMTISPEIFVEDGKLFIWCKCSDVISSEELLNRQMEEVESSSCLEDANMLYGL